MSQDTVQPSNDARATALAIAAKLFNYADYDAKGNTTTGKDREKCAAERTKLIAAAAKELFAAVKS